MEAEADVSRLRVFDADNYAQGQVIGFAERGWQIISQATSGFGSCVVNLTADQARMEYLQFGRMVLIQHAKLPAWAGMIDTPWVGSLPAQMTIYDAQCLLALRAPTDTRKFSGSTAEIARDLIRVANDQEEMYVRLGECDIDDDSREETLDQRTIWEQLGGLIKRAGGEMVVRPEIEDDNQLVIYLDILNQVGHVAPIELTDGDEGNMRVVSARIESKIINGVQAINGQKDGENRLYTPLLIDDDSREAFRLRSKVIQYSSVKEMSTLLANGNAALKGSRYPMLKMEVEVFDVGDTFFHTRPGNRMMAHASRVQLPGGIAGWRGMARILAMQFMERSNVLRATIGGWYFDPNEEQT